MNTFLAFLAVSAVVIVTPGPDTALTLRNTFVGGRSGGLFTALGVSIGQATWALATSAGIVALIVASEPVFLAIKYAGAGCLIYLGLRALYDAFRPSDEPHAAAALGQPSRRLIPMTAVWQGAISNLANPKMAVFFASLLPQFISGTPTFAGLLALGLCFSLLTFAWLSLYAVVAARLGRFLRRSSIRRSIEAVMGSMLIGLGIRIAVEEG